MEFRQALPPDACGTVLLSCHDNQLELNVRVAYSGKAYEGVEFIYNSDSERDSVAHLIAFLAGSTDRPRLALVQ